MLLGQLLVQVALHQQVLAGCGSRTPTGCRFRPGGPIEGAQAGSAASKGALLTDTYYLADELG